MSNRLASQTQKTAGIPNGMRTATIAAVSSTGAVTLNISGGQISSGVGVLKSYTPIVGDTVAVFRQDSSWLVLGSIAAALIASRGELTGTASVSFTSLTSTFVSVSFGATFPAAPAVTTNIDSGSGPTALWGSRATSITTTGFSLYLYSSNVVAATWASIPVTWVATARS